jgi:membrane-bound lytic murein transglycosylase D
MVFRFFNIVLFFSFSICFSQVKDSLAVTNGNNATLKQISTKKDSLLIQKVEDNLLAANFDQKLLEDLYSNSLYDTIYNSITELSFDKVEYQELSTELLKTRLAELSSKTPFNVEYNSDLESVIKSYLKNRKETLQRLINLSAFYFPMFERELDNHDLPLELKYLAIVESALKPRAKSRVGATGLWQFMYETGKMYGLEVSSYVDERSDPLKSTEAAAKYLSKLYEIFGDWDLALAAYNSGPGNVTKAIRRSGGYQNYWNIRHNLPRETAGYLPAFLATMYIFEYAEQHGFKKPSPEVALFETDTIRVKHTITLDQVSEVTGVEMEELQFLNPSYKLDIIPHIKGKDYVLRLPKSVIGDFVTNEDQIYEIAKAELNKREKPMPQIFQTDTKTTHRVKSGEFLGLIARKYSVRVSDIKKWNGLRSNTLKKGQNLTIFSGNSIASDTTSTSKPTTSKVVSSSSKTYTVKNGDSLWSISQKFSGVSVQNIKDWNDISGSKLKPGMKLKVSKS